MTGSTLVSDVLLPAATWYEKHDINTTDMHPFIHPFTPAINPPWQAKTDWETFQLIADKLSELAKDHLGVRKDVMATPLMHDSRTRWPCLTVWSGTGARARRTRSRRSPCRA